MQECKVTLTTINGTALVNDSMALNDMINHYWEHCFDDMLHTFEDISEEIATNLEIDAFEVYTIMGGNSSSVADVFPYFCIKDELLKFNEILNVESKVLFDFAMSLKIEG